MILFSRFIFLLLGLFALVFAWNYSMMMVQGILGRQLNGYLFIALGLSTLSIVAAMVAFYGMRQARNLSSLWRIRLAVGYTVILLPVILFGVFY